MTGQDFKINNFDVIKTKNTSALNAVISEIVDGLGKLIGEGKLPNTVQTIFHYDFDGRKYDVYKDVGHKTVRAAKIFGVAGNCIDIRNFVIGGISELSAEKIAEARDFLGFSEGATHAEKAPAEISLTERISILEEQNKFLASRLAQLERVATVNKTLEERVDYLEKFVGVKN